MSKYTIDIETNNLLSNMLDFTSLPYKLNSEAKLYCVVIRNVETDEVSFAVEGDITTDWLKTTLADATEIILHNGIKFDLIALKLFGVLEYEVGYLDQEDKLFGKPVKIVDTLVRSRLLNPDRYGGHGLKAWGIALGEHKGDYTDFSHYNEEMLEYCKQDTKVTSLIYKTLATEYDSYEGWRKAEKLENKLADLAVKRETYGFWFNKDLAIQCLEDLTEKLTELENRVNPILPPKPMNKTNLKKFTPPPVQFKKDRSFSANFLKFVEKHNGVLGEDSVEFYGEKFSIPVDRPIKLYETANISDLDHVKMHLISLGWIPTEWKVRDLTKDTKKQSLTYEKRVETLDRWLNQTFDENKYKDLRLEELGLGFDKASLRRKLVEQLRDDKPVRVPTSPCVRVGVEKELCPNLVKLGDKVDFANDFTLFLTYKHRKSSIAGGDLEDVDYEDEYPNTGFLSMYRTVDGRIPTPSIEIGASTNRYRHIGVCNVARASSIYGKEMRSLFGCGQGMYQFGFDFSSLEARIQGHYILPFNGEELAEQLLASKPNDIHCYSEDTEILTQNGWKFFGNLTPQDKVAQYDDGIISFVKPLDVVWQEYEGDMYTDPKTQFKVTPNHRVLVKSFSSGDSKIVRADEFKPSSDKRYIVGGRKNEGDLNLSDAFIQLLVATQADGYLAKDCSAITYSFTKLRKIERMENILNTLLADYTKSESSRKGRTEVIFRLKASDLSMLVRNYLDHNKSFTNELLNLDFRGLKTLLDEVKYWDGTARDNGDLVLDTTDKTSCEFVQTVASLVGYKTNFSVYNKTTSYGDVTVYRVYVSNNTVAVKSANKPLEVSHYKGFIGCVSVPSGLVLVRRNGEIVVSGNTLNANKLGISRDQAKSISYALMYGASYKKLKSMLGLSDSEAKALYDAYWEAVKPLSDLRDEVVKVWKRRGSKYVIGIDGRKIMTRSQHSLLNALFQSGGVINAKYTTVFLFQYLEDRGYKCDPFVYEDLDCCGMIEYHDECQLAVKPSLIPLKKFNNEDELKEFVSNWKGKQLGAETTLKSGKICIALPNVISDAVQYGIDQAEKHTNLKVPLGYEFVTANNWYNCH